MTMKIIGLDPASTRNLGWSIIKINIDDSGSLNNFECIADTFVIPVVEENWQACWPIFMIMEQLLVHERPDVVVVEKTSSFSGGFVTGQVANCMGAIFCACGKHDIKIEFVYPTHVKKIVADNGRATKKEMKLATKDLLTKLGIKDTKFSSEHAYDAASSILCWLSDKSIIEIKEL